MTNTQKLSAEHPIQCQHGTIQVVSFTRVSMQRFEGSVIGTGRKSPIAIVLRRPNGNIVLAIDKDQAENVEDQALSRFIEDL